jgi:hypothetical protein
MKVGPSGSAIRSLIPSHRGPLWLKSHGGERCGNVGTLIPAGTVERGERLCVYKFDECLFIMVFKFLRLKVGRLLGHDMLG